MVPSMVRIMLALVAMLTVTPVLAAGEPLRPEVGKPLQAAQDAIRRQKFRDALALVGQAAAAGALTPRESALIGQLRGIAASGAGDLVPAARAFETAIASGQLSAPEEARLTLAVGNLYYRSKDYPKAAAWLRKAVDGGGTDDSARTLLAQAYYLSADYTAAVNTLKGLISGSEPPDEAQLQLLADAESKRNNADGHDAALAALARYYPKPEYWVPLIQRAQARPGFAPRLSLDALRLHQATGTLSTAAQYVEAAELALREDLPAEAKAFLDKGFAAGLLGNGADGERHRRLRTLADQKTAADRASLARSEAEALEAKDGNVRVDIGPVLVSHGQPRKAAELLESGLAGGGVRHADDARLHLGIAYWAAGDREKAARAFKAVRGRDGTRDLASLWLLLVGSETKG